MNRERYFDHAASTPIDPEVLDAMLPWLRDGFGNAHSIHEAGRAAMAAVSRARFQVAELLGTDDPSEVVFTSGATEANNWVLSAYERVACSPFEHPSVLEPVLARKGEVLGHTGWDLHSPVTDVDLVAVMDINNETGVRLVTPPTKARIHRDITQTLGKMPLPEDFHLASFSSHKLYGPKGVGGLWIKDQELLAPLIRGGGQEFGLRSGTLNVAGIVGFGEAARIALERMGTDAEHARMLRKTVIDVFSEDNGIQVNSANEETSSPFVLSVSFRGMVGETLVVEMDRAGYGISSRSACSASSHEPSKVLAALGLSPEWLSGTVRISFGRANTYESAQSLAQTMLQIVRKLRTLT